MFYLLKELKDGSIITNGVLFFFILLPLDNFPRAKSPSVGWGNWSLGIFEAYSWWYRVLLGRVALDTSAGYCINWIAFLSKVSFLRLTIYGQAARTWICLTLCFTRTPKHFSLSWFSPMSFKSCRENIEHVTFKCNRDKDCKGIGGAKGKIINTGFLPCFAMC